MTAQDKTGLTKADYERLSEFRYLLRRFLEFSERAAEGTGLTAQQHQALLAIKGFAGRDYATTGELAERLCIRHHSAVGLIDRLVAKELVTRRIGADDRRQVLVTLTPVAETMLAGLSAAHRDELERLSPLLRDLLGHFGPDTL
jgi:DNA-binding MarR family transcriptional regulator